MAAALPYVATSLSLGATGYSVYQSREAAQEGKEANRAERNRVQVEQARNIRRAVAASRVQQARLQAQGVAGGTGQGTGTAGAVTSEASTTGANIGAANQIQNLQLQGFDALRRQQQSSFRSQLGTLAAGSLGSFSQFQGPDTGSLAGLYNAYNYFAGGSNGN